MWTADEIAHLCYTHYSSKLPKQGKPEPKREWTLLAAVIKVNSAAESACCPRDEPFPAIKEVVAMGTGTKCIGQSKMRKDGDILNDSHAEVIAKRSFQRYLLHQLKAATLRQDSIFIPGTKVGKWKLKPDLSFVFFSSHTPCGDASIIPMLEVEDQPCPLVTGEEAVSRPAEMSRSPERLGNKRKQEDSPNHSVTKRSRTEPSDSPNGSTPQQETEKRESFHGPPSPGRSAAAVNGPSREEAPAKAGPAGTKAVDVHRTGAKCVPGEAGDPRSPGVGYHRVGLLRVKPGRGDRTCSMSCSDKLARWNVLGCQGALLMHLLQEPLYLAAVVIGKCPFSPEAVRRAVIDRCRHVSLLPDGFRVREPQILQSNLLFEHSRSAVRAKGTDGTGKLIPCGAAISWSAVPEQPLDVTSNGFRQGATKKAIGSLQARSKICKAELFGTFQKLVDSISEDKQPASLRAKKLETYWDYKEAAVYYQETWKALQRQAFGCWIKNPPEYQQFK
ncbi:tRNA-specific adenosine deaminase 1 isoform X2 [Tachyglossus aculeatus]|uniref:tRNA-specific adenosine deaminase 1 isoform X2 n=1 Tax=Tachyglossus aculeatus TaxID=9261 RepID=UPI0018F384EF|nr:tRNA-specific adenosine deaminase 1 isoform X2 [Tachyglossus aculeatus]